MPNHKNLSEKKTAGPYLAAAIFCETIIEDKQDNVLSAIRIIDTFTMTLAASTPPDVPSEKNRLPVNVNGLLIFKTGSSTKKTHALRIVMQSPSGKRGKVLEETIPFPPEPQASANVRLATTIAVKEGGLFWMDVFLDTKRLARMPLMIHIQRQELAPHSPIKSDATS
ncbi:MAG TPA: hypothetical protein DDY78_14955 [Planctomycetales bacterium]|jgi:hypothetical protein|nr:hypothetical protein [Planctomycetales bacterium]